MKPFTLSREQVRELDRRAIEEYGVPGIVLMENAGRGCAELLMRLNPTKQPVVILCGPGNNGGDGFVIARHLDVNRWPVTLWLFAEYQIRSNVFETEKKKENTGSAILKISSNALYHLQFIGDKKWIFITDPNSLNQSLLKHLDDDLKSECWVVDALFGTGLSRELSTPYSVLIDLFNAAGNPVLAVDLPSGLDCDTGAPLGPTIRATHTATFVAPKKGFLNPKSKAWTGEVHIVDIGAPRVLVEQYAG